MSDLRDDRYVPLRTAPRTLVKRYTFSRAALAEDEATREMVAIIKVFDNYIMEAKDRPKPPGHKTR